jgi:ferrochelatase
MKTGILICNIGTPKAPDRDSVKEYLDEFLMDKRVIGAPWIIRYPLVKWLITPRRSSSSAKKYQSVWMKEGSPLLVYTHRLVQNLQRTLGQNVVVRTAMRYSSPSLLSVLNEMRSLDVKELLIVPMFPQFAEATTGSLMATFQEIDKKNEFKKTFFPTFYNHSLFIESFAEITRDTLRQSQFKPDHYLFSYHGLPESQVRAAAPQCLRESNCCELPTSCLMNCYRAQCVSSTKSLARALGISEENYSISFQSRLGPVKWIEPYTEDSLVELAQKGKNLAVICPSFVTDCIETLEEIGLEGAEIFQKSGGKGFKLIPCLNDHTVWSENFAKMLLNAIEDIKKE